MDPMQLSSMTRPTSILLATDLNELPLLLPVAIDQAKMTGAMLWLLHVIPPTLNASLESGAFACYERDKQYRDAEATLSQVASQVREQELACAYEIRRWYPVDQIKACIREHQIDRLIVGTASRGKLGKLLIGSVAEELIRSLKIPVCTVGPCFVPGARGTAPRIVVAVSLRHHPEESLRFAVDLAAASRAELTVLHVTEQDRFDEGLIAGARSKLDALLKRISRENLVPYVRIRCGEPAEEIIEECETSKPDLLILSAFAASPGIARFRAGVVYRVIARTPCPTFTLRSGSRAKRSGTYREFCGAQMGSSDGG